MILLQNIIEQIVSEDCDRNQTNIHEYHGIQPIRKHQCFPSAVLQFSCSQHLKLSPVFHMGTVRPEHISAIVCLGNKDGDKVLDCEYDDDAE